MKNKKRENLNQGFRFGVLIISSLTFATGESSFAGSALTYSPTTTITEQTSINTSASTLFTDNYYSYETGRYQANANGDMVPANISKIPLSSLFTGAAAKAKIFAYTQSWFCHLDSNESNGQMNPATSPEQPKCGSHIDIGYNSGDATQIANTVDDLKSRGIQGVLIDWEGAPADDPKSQTNIQNNDAIVQYKKNAEESSTPFTFAVIEDEGVAGCTNGWVPCQKPASVIGDESTMSRATLQVIFDLNYAVANFTGSPAYLRNSAGAPIIETFNLDGYATNAKGGAQSIDWGAVNANLPVDPLKGMKPVIIFENSAGMTHAMSGGGYSWVSPTAWSSFSLTSGDPFGLNYLTYELSSLIKTRSATSAPLVLGASIYKGFDDTVVNGWGSGSRYLDQECGKTLLKSAAAVNAAFSTKELDYIGIPTWDDYEEATETETGIDNCLTSLNPTISGTVLSWTPVFGSSIDGVRGDESTVHHYTIYVSQDGVRLMPVSQIAPGVHTFDLSQAGLSTGGNYQVYVQAVGQPMLRNTLVQAKGSYTVVVAQSANISGEIINAFSGAPVSGAIVSYSGGSVTTNSSGLYTFSNLAAGSYVINVTHSGYLSNSASVVITNGAAMTSNIKIATAGIISGTVQTSAGAAHAGVTVKISGGVLPTTVSLTSGSTGKFTTTWIAVGSYTVTCTASSVGTGSSTVSLVAGQTLLVNCRN